MSVKVKINKFTLLVIAPVVILGLYCVSVFIRVSFAEQEYFGRSTRLPVCLHVPAYGQPAKLESFVGSTYT